ncbi:MAG: serine protease [Vicinamibacterales bacterium]
MVRVSLVVAAVLWAAGQPTGVLRVSVTVAEPGLAPRPLARHVLLVSDNPPTTSPRRLVTGADGTGSLRLPPGNYTVESDAPVVLGGTAYSWMQTVDVTAGAEASLALTAENAERTTAADTANRPPRPPDASDVLIAWDRSVVSVWTPTAHASGVVVDAAGLIATSRQLVGDAPVVDAQIDAATTREGRVLVADPAADVAIVWVDPTALANAPPVPLDCTRPAPAGLTNGQPIVALGKARGRPVRMTEGALNRVASRTMIADLGLEDDTLGGPVFAIGGGMIGLTSRLAEKEGDPRDDTRVVRADAVCGALAAARTRMAASPAPSPAPRPIEPATVLSEAVLERQMQGRAGALKPYAVSTPGFDVAFLTPLLVYASRDAIDYANWSGYVAERPTVLLVRVTPKQEEGFWTTVARGLAMTQGLALPPIRHFRPGFARMRVTCGATDVTPIHPFLLERRVTETDAVHEGLYVFTPDALTPACGTVTLEIVSEKEPGKGDTVTVDPKVIDQIWQDFAPYRAAR